MSGLAVDEVAAGTEVASPHRYGTGPRQMSRTGRGCSVLYCTAMVVFFLTPSLTSLHGAMQERECILRQCRGIRSCWKWPFPGQNCRGSSPHFCQCKIRVTSNSLCCRVQKDLFPFSSYITFHFANPKSLLSKFLLFSTVSPRRAGMSSKRLAGRIRTVCLIPEE